MTYTKDQIQRALKKFAVAYGRWNAPDGDRRKKERDLSRAGWKVIRKTGNHSHYLSAVREQFKKDKRESDD